MERRKKTSSTADSWDEEEEDLSMPPRPPMCTNKVEMDPIAAKIDSSGCLKLLSALKLCMEEKQDWQMCQFQALDFKRCLERNNVKPAKTTNSNINPKTGALINTAGHIND